MEERLLPVGVGCGDPGQEVPDILSELGVATAGWPGDKGAAGVITKALGVFWLPHGRGSVVEGFLSWVRTWPPLLTIMGVIYPLQAQVLHLQNGSVIVRADGMDSLVVTE